MQDILTQLITDLLSSVAKQGPVVAVLLIVVLYLKQMEERKSAANDKLINAMNEERRDRIAILEAHVVECNDRHDKTQSKHESLLMRLAQIEQHQQPHPPQ